MKTINRDIVAAMIISADGKLFLDKEHPDKTGTYLDTWHIPGGGVDSGESLEQGLIREIQEEIGFDLSPYKIELYDDLGHGESEKLYNGERVLAQMHFNVFRIELDEIANNIEFVLGEDLEDYQWVDFKDLKSVKLTPPSIELFNRKGIFKD